MNKQIAALVNLNDITSAFNEKGFIKVYEKNTRGWEVVKQIAINIYESLDSKSIRGELLKIIKELENCRLFIGKEVSGLPYTLLDKNGFQIWELEGEPEEFLDYILDEVQKDITNNKASTKKDAKNNLIEMKKDGCYSINLKKLQESNIGVTSKQALLSFFNNQIFYELEVICSHIPPWFETEFENLNLKADAEKLGTNEYRVKIYHKTCNE